MIRARIGYRVLDSVLHVEHHGIETTIEPPFSPNGVREAAKDVDGDGIVDTWLVEARKGTAHSFVYRVSDKNADGVPDDLLVKLGGWFEFERIGKQSTDKTGNLRIAITGRTNSEETTEYTDLDMDGLVDVRKHSSTQGTSTSILVLRPPKWILVDGVNERPEGYFAHWIAPDGTSSEAVFKDQEWQRQ